MRRAGGRRGPGVALWLTRVEPWSLAPWRGRGMCGTSKEVATLRAAARVSKLRCDVGDLRAGSVFSVVKAGSCRVARPKEPAVVTVRRLGHRRGTRSERTTKMAAQEPGQKGCRVSF